MKFAVENKTYQIYFQYGSSELSLGKNNQPTFVVPSVQCFIRELIPTPPDVPPSERPRKTVGTGEALCSPRDRYDKYVGRKIAFTRALEDTGFNRDTRARFWENFLLTHKVAS